MASAAPAHRDAADAPPRMNYQYADFDAAPPLHRQVAALAIEGRFADEIIAKKEGLFPTGTRKQKLALCRKILTHGPVSEHIREQIAMNAAEERHVEQELRRSMTRGRAASVDALVRKVEAGDLTLREALGAASFFADRHPDGAFVKRSHTKIDQTVDHVVSGDALRKIKENAALARVTCAEDAHLINVACAPSVPVLEGSA